MLLRMSSFYSRQFKFQNPSPLMLTAGQPVSFVVQIPIALLHSSHSTTVCISSQTIPRITSTTRYVSTCLVLVLPTCTGTWVRTKHEQRLLLLSLSLFLPGPSHRNLR